jgi:hypothetical protein
MSQANMPPLGHPEYPRRGQPRVTTFQMEEALGSDNMRRCYATETETGAACHKALGHVAMGRWLRNSYVSRHSAIDMREDKQYRYENGQPRPVHWYEADVDTDEDKEPQS